MQVQAKEAPSMQEREELFLLIGELESEVERERQRAEDALSKLTQTEQAAQQPSNTTVQQLSQQAGLIARAVMEADASRSELQAQQLAKQQLAEELDHQRTLRQQADTTLKSLRAECDSMHTDMDSLRAETRQLQQQLISERASHQENYAMMAELSAAHSDAKRRVAELSTSNTELASQLAVECTRHAQARTEIETVTASLQAQLATVQTGNERLRELADEHQRQTQQLGRECAKLQTTEQSLRADRRRDLQDLEAVRIELAEERAAHDATRLTLLAEIGALEDEVATQQPQLERLTLEKARLKARVAALRQQQQVQQLPQAEQRDEEDPISTFRSTFSRIGDSDVGFGTPSKVSPTQPDGGDIEATAAVFERLYHSARAQSHSSDTDSAVARGGNGTGPRHLELDLALTNTGLSPARRAMDTAVATGGGAVIDSQKQSISRDNIGHCHLDGDSARSIATQSGSVAVGSNFPAEQASASRATLLYKLRRIGGTEVASKMVSTLL